MQPKDLSALIQELIAIPATRWKKEVTPYDHHTPQNPHYLESYQIEHRSFRIYLESYYGGVNSGTVKLNLFNSHNGRGLPLDSHGTLRKDIFLCARQIPTAIAELYAKIQENHNQLETKIKR